MTKKIYVTFDNFTLLDDTAERWMKPEEHAALPELSDYNLDLWENYIRARSAHKAAYLAVMHALQYGEGTPQAEVLRQGKVFAELYSLYCDWANTKSGKKIIKQMAALLEKERERG